MENIVRKGETTCNKLSSIFIEFEFVICKLFQFCRVLKFVVCGLNMLFKLENPLSSGKRSYKVPPTGTYTLCQKTRFLSGPKLTPLPDDNTNVNSMMICL